jgi:hypothetical protein
MNKRYSRKKLKYSRIQLKYYISWVLNEYGNTENITESWDLLNLIIIIFFFLS